MEDIKAAIPDGTTHFDSGQTNLKWIRAGGDACHDYWCLAEGGWVTFEGPHNPIRKHWIPIEIFKTTVTPR